MERLTCVVVGGGYAGIHAVKALQKSLKGVVRELKLILINRDPYHLRKVLLFKPAALQEDIAVPLRSLFPEGEGVDIVQGEVTRVNFEAKQLAYNRSKGGEGWLGYDVLVMAAGSLVGRPKPEQGGIALTSPEAAEQIRLLIWFRGKTQKSTLYSGTAKWVWGSPLEVGVSYKVTLSSVEASWPKSSTANVTTSL